MREPDSDPLDNEVFGLQDAMLCFALDANPISQASDHIGQCVLARLRAILEHVLNS